jgi:hypothetical protein
MTQERDSTRLDENKNHHITNGSSALPDSFDDALLDIELPVCATSHHASDSVKPGNKLQPKRGSPPEVDADLLQLLVDGDFREQPARLPPVVVGESSKRQKLDDDRDVDDLEDVLTAPGLAPPPQTPVARPLSVVDDGVRLRMCLEAVLRIESRLDGLSSRAPEDGALLDSLLVKAQEDCRGLSEQLTATRAQLQTALTELDGFRQRAAQGRALLETNIEFLTGNPTLLAGLKRNLLPPAPPLDAPSTVVDEDGLLALLDL